MLFEPLDDDVYLPTARARGPWDPGALHGGPVAALLARAVEDAAGELNVARLTFEILRPVPVAPLRVTSEVVRPGRKVQLRTASVTTVDGGVEVSRVTALLLRAASVDVPDLPAEHRPAESPGEPLPGARTRIKSGPAWDSWEAFHNEGMEMRFAAGRFEEPGPVTVWMRLCQPVVGGEPPTPVQRVAAAADFGNGISSVLPWTDYLFINPDLAVHLARPPQGEWVCLESRSMLSPEDGMGLAESALYDEHGRIGRSVQSLLVDRR